MSRSGAWQWFVTPGGLATALIAAILIAAAAVARERLGSAWREVRERHAARMRRKYGQPRPAPFLHPAVFEVQGHQRAAERALFLVNVGKGEARGVVLTDAPASTVRVRGERSWDEILGGDRVRIALEGDLLAIMGSPSVMVTWVDARGAAHADEVVLDESAMRVLGKLF